MTCSLTFKSCDKNYRHWRMWTRRFNGINGHRCQYSKDNHPHSKTDNLKRKRTCDEKLHQLCTSRTFAIIVLRGNVQISSRTVSITSGYPRLLLCLMAMMRLRLVFLSVLLLAGVCVSIPPKKKTIFYKVICP